MSDLVSIVTVTYNAQDTIQVTLDSVFGQTYTNFEVIVIDGNSKDNTVNIINENRSRIKYFISESDNGIYDAMNKGIKAANGEWVVFMNSGDLFYDNDVLSNIFDNDNSDVDVIYGNRISVFSFGEYYHLAKPLSYFDSEFPLFHQSTFIRRSLHGNYLYDLSYKICADYDALYRMWKSGARFKYVNLYISMCECEEGFSSKLSNQKLRIDEDQRLTNNNDIISKVKSHCRLYGKIIVYTTLRLISTNMYLRYYQHRMDNNIWMRKKA